MTFEGHLQYCKQFHCLYLTNARRQFQISQVIYVSNYFYCRRPIRLLHDAERDLFAAAKFLVSITAKIFSR